MMVLYLLKFNKLLKKNNYLQSYRIHNINHTDLRYVDVGIHLGPLDLGAEFVTRFETNINNNFTWYTGQNSVEYVDRSYNAYIDERVGGNFFSMCCY